MPADGKRPRVKVTFRDDSSQHRVRNLVRKINRDARAQTRAEVDAADA